MSDSPADQPEPSQFEIQQAAIARIARGIAAEIDGPWDTFTFAFAQAGRQTACHVIPLRDDELIPVKPPRQVIAEAQALRQAMYQPGKGTWFGMTLTASSDGKAQTDFDYDSPAAIWTKRGGLSDIAYYDDQQRYPRDEAHIPDWLRPKLELGRIARQKFDAIAERKRRGQAD